MHINEVGRYDRNRFASGTHSFSLGIVLGVIKIDDIRVIP